LRLLGEQAAKSSPSLEEELVAGLKMDDPGSKGAS
jgi:hypothetical protein